MFCMILAVLTMNPVNATKLATNDLIITLDGGYVTSLKSKKGIEYLPNEPKAPLLSLRAQNKVLQPESMAYDKAKNIITLSFSNKAVATIHLLNKRTHLTFELTNLTPKEDVELVIWGPYPTTIKESIGETVGVVRDNDYAIGIQALNIKTLGGYPNTEDDVEPSYDIFATGYLVDMKSEDIQKEQYRGDTARKTDFGSVLQAYTRDRSKTRIIENWGHKKFTAPAYDDGGVIGSKIALFGCPREQALELLGEIELTEGLPHPLIDGIWGKVNPNATASFLIMPFGEANLDECLELTQKAGLRYLYTDDCFDTWGHFALNHDRFPDGWASMKRCVDRAAAKGIRLGVHTLSNFITTNDPYVTPIPDPRLAVIGISPLKNSIDDKQTTIELEDVSFFGGPSCLKTVRLEQELIQFGSVEGNKLVNCTRGAFGTKATSHTKGAEVGLLMDHDYKVFLTNTELSVEVAKTIARFFNETGVQQFSFDGLEGNLSTGMGQYGRTLFTQTWYDNLKPELRGQVINDASNPGHFFWHVYTRMNWGEPWYAGFRESHTQYRLMNQRYFERNLMPHMLGWFKMTPETSLADAEWLLARAAGFDAGFCLCTSPEVVAQNGRAERILEAIRQWETARLAGAFTDEQKERLKKIENEFELVAVDENGWILMPVYSKKDRLPVSGYADIDLDNPFNEQTIDMVVTVPEGTVLNSIKYLDAEIVGPFEGPCALWIYRRSAIVFNSHWQLLRSIDNNHQDARCMKGKQILRIDGDISGENPSDIKIEVRLYGSAEDIGYITLDQ